MTDIPVPPPTWPDNPDLSDAYEEAAQLVASAFPTRPWALKDPRLCVLLPFWRRVADDAVAAVLVVRNPVDAARSYEDWLNPEPANRFAWWEHYMRCAVRDLAGLPVLVGEYDKALDDPFGWCRSALGWLADVGIAVDDRRVEQGAAFLDAGTRKHVSSATELDAAPESCRKLYTRLVQACGAHPSWEPAIVL